MTTKCIKTIDEVAKVSRYDEIFTENDDIFGVMGNGAIWAADRWEICGGLCGDIGGCDITAYIYKIEKGCFALEVYNFDESEYFVCGDLKKLQEFAKNQVFSIVYDYLTDIENFDLNEFRQDTISEDLENFSIDGDIGHYYENEDGCTYYKYNDVNGEAAMFYVSDEGDRFYM